MKKIITSILILFTQTATAQTNVVIDSLAKPVISAIGKPAGKKTEIKITKSGGRLKSSDGLVELIIPEGAVAPKTIISIEPITNLMSNANGPAYRLEPSGIQFNKPLQLIFHYDEEETKDKMQLLLGIAMQDDKGQWFRLKNSAIDTTAKTISGNINHFSDWAKFDAVKLYPSSGRLKIHKAMTLTIDVLSSEEDELVDLITDETLAQLKKTKIPFTTTWKANEITNGNAAVGKINVGSKTSIGYTAPATLPIKNPVAITSELNGLTYKYKGIVFKDLKLVSNILIYDVAYEVKMINSIDGNAGSVLGNCSYKDTGSFVVSLNGKQATIIEKVNKNTVSELDYTGQCTIVQLKPGTGNIHIAGRPVIKIIPSASLTGAAVIEITFGRYPTILPLLQFTCPNRKGGTFTSTNAQANAMIAGMIAAFPQQIKFEAKEEEQTILQIGEAGSEIFTKFTVKQIKED